ncbi:MAG: glucose-6-phosphate isomerase [Chloroflexota bacterium]
MSALTDSLVWKKLESQASETAILDLRELFEFDKNRFEKFSLEINGILFDYSKNLITEQTMDLLLELAEFAGVEKARDDMFSGKHVNITEDRPALHVALRNVSDESISVDGKNVMPDVQRELAKMQAFTEALHAGSHLGASGKKLTNIVNIGIGGSDLGPAMVCEALKHYAKEGMRACFVSNVDPADIAGTLEGLDPETTIFIIASKTFTTQETLANAEAAKEWFLGAGFKEEDMARHFAAVSTNVPACEKFGIPEENIFTFWDWVGGRYSLWSSIGLSISLYVGYDNFMRLLLGAHRVDKRFRTDPLDRNVPVIMAMLGIWYRNFIDADSYAVIPYSEELRKFPAFLQQLDMESNGKRITLDGMETDYLTGPAVWGAAGTNAQHSFFQLLHQGCQTVPVDFIGVIKPHKNIGTQHEILLSNFFAQTAALAFGKNEFEVYDELKNENMSKERMDALAPHKIFTGNRPTNSFLLKELTPSTLGSLIALYEHKIFVQGVVWNINSFDQWGVELGKSLARKLLPTLTGAQKVKSLDSSTTGLIEYYWKEKNKRE